MKTFKDLIVWQKSHELVMLVYKITKNFPKEEIYVLTSQIRRAAISVPSNIVEGFKRKGKKESLQFYHTSNASHAELSYQLFLAKELNYIGIKEYNILEEKINEVGKLLYGWINSQST